MSHQDRTAFAAELRSAGLTWLQAVQVIATQCRCTMREAVSAVQTAYKNAATTLPQITPAGRSAERRGSAARAGRQRRR
jgi:hypothetical protein